MNYKFHLNSLVLCYVLYLIHMQELQVYNIIVSQAQY